MSTESTPNVVALIERKKRGGELTAEELGFLCEGFVAKRIPDYQMAAWLMAVCWRGMTEAETLALTRAMVDSGERLDWSGIGRPTVDKHSTGGVGDKTSLVLVPLMAAAGAAFVKMSGRGLGHTGGTLDKLEAIPGFSVSLGLDEMRAQVERIGCALVGQSPELVPADGLLYALRDVTGTVDSVPLIAGSIMSKKLAGGAGTIVLDVKWGVGAFMRTVEEARALAGALVRIGEGAGRRTRAVLSPMEEPLGRAVGNALEVQEAIDTLRGGGPEELWELTLELGTHLLLLAGLAGSTDEARTRLTELRDSGAGAATFAELIRAQGGDPRVVEDPEILPRAPYVRDFVSDADGDRWVAALDARGVGEAALALGAGRRTKTDPVDPAVGIVLRARIGDRVAPGGALAEIHARTEAEWNEAAGRLRELYRLSPEPVAKPATRYEIIGG
ncbi:MAG: thymidine phosphorylase [Gemmatimonadetes bacterium]|nr:thymidine phosphorylase [Gemmatimonadota bacterium]